MRAASGLTRRVAPVVAGAVAAQYVPSTVVLGQWTGLRSLPGRWCRWRGPATDQVAVTFDDGPSSEATPALLDRLDELGWRATFFCLGTLAEAHPELVGETVKRGHQVETHGYRHVHHLARGPRFPFRDLRRAVRVMEQCGQRPSYYRPTYGQATAATLAAARSLRLETVLWSAWGREWTDTDAAGVGRRLMSGVAPGAILLLHDNDAFGPPGMWRLGLDALDTLAVGLERQGLVPVTLSELLGGPGGIVSPRSPEAVPAHLRPNAGSSP